MTCPTWRRLVFLAALVAVLPGASSCSRGPFGSPATRPTAPVHRGGSAVLNWFNNTGNGAWVTTLDPALAIGPTAVSDIQLINAGLVRVRYPSLQIVPDLATWTVSPDHLTWTFHIRPTARFSNGDPVTAQDAAWSLTRALLPATDSSVALTYLGHIQGAGAVAAGGATALKGLSVVNERTLRVTLDSPVAHFLPALSYPTGDVLDRRVLENKPAGGSLSTTCTANVGAGPFRPVCRNATSDKSSFFPPGHTPAIDFQPNPYYYGPHPRIRIHAPFVADLRATWKQYRTGALDGISLAPVQVPAARRLPGFTRAPLLQTDFLTPNVQIYPFNNLSCRLAVAYAIDRRAITSRVLRATEGTLFGVIPPGLLGYLGQPVGVPSHNPVLARSYLARCPGRLRNITLAYDGSSDDLQREFGAIARELASIGARIRLRPLGFHAWTDVIGQSMMATRRQEQIAQNLWIADYPDPQDWCDVLLHSGQTFNVGGFSNPEYDRLVDQASRTFDTSRRAALYVQAERLALNQGAEIPVGFSYGTYLVSPHVRGMVPGSAGVWPANGDWSKVKITP